MYPKYRLSIVALIMFCFVLFLIELSPSEGATVYENFDNNQYNQKLFSIEGGASVAVVNNRLEITILTGSSGRSQADIYCKLPLKGDFDIQVDFTLISWPAGSGVGAGFFGVIGEVDRRSFMGPPEWGGVQECYLARTSDTGTESRSNTSDVSGKLRYTRVGNTFEAFYWKNNDWQLIESVTEPQIGAETDYAVIGVFCPQVQLMDREAKVAFDNIIITNQYIGINLSPMLPLLLD
jgi:hypothetical protein